jgi:hypothetical protein
MRNPLWEIAWSILLAMIFLVLMVLYVGRINLPFN